MTAYHEGTKDTKKSPYGKNPFVIFVSSWFVR